MKKSKETQKKILRKIGIIVLMLFCLISLLSLIFVFQQYSKSGKLEIEYKINGKPTEKHQPMRVSNIEPWMTFNYLNIVFELDTDYLKHYLNINDTRYPNISINMYARHYDLSSEDFLENIKQAITNYPYRK